MFPEFACLTQTQVEAYFELAGMGPVFNDISNPARCILPQLMYLVTAHVAWLMSPKDANGNPATEGSTAGGGLVGRISQATQGSVNVTLEMNSSSSGPQEAWWNQTRYGAFAYVAMAGFRTARYTVSPTRVGGPVFPAAPWLPINFWGPVTELPFVSN